MADIRLGMRFYNCFYNFPLDNNSIFAYDESYNSINESVELRGRRGVSREPSDREESGVFGPAERIPGEVPAEGSFGAVVLKLPRRE